VLVHVSVLGVNATKLSGIEANEVKRKSMPNWIGPFYVLSHPSENVYEIDLPRGMRVHRKVNVDKLKVATDLDCDKPPPVQVSRDGVTYAVESIIGHRKTGGRTFMLVKWVGGGYEPTWEPLANVSHLHILLADYFQNLRTLMCQPFRKGCFLLTIHFSSAHVAAEFFSPSKGFSQPPSARSLHFFFDFCFLFPDSLQCSMMDFVTPACCYKPPPLCRRDGVKWEGGGKCHTIGNPS